MKKIILIIPVIVLIVIAIAWAEPKNDGIKFYDKSWQEVLKKAHDERKPIFLDIYATWCGPCKLLKKQTFRDKNVAEYFNEHFVNTSFDGESGDGYKLAGKFKIEGYPSLFILDPDGNVISASVGYMSPEELVEFGRQATAKKMQAGK